MREVTGNLWTFPADVRVITTNGAVKKDGGCVMGRGCALEAKTRYPGIDKVLGQHIRLKGNIVSILREDDADGDTIVSFPVKHHWREEADPKLIEVSARTLSGYADLHGWRVIVMPRPGCGNGRLRWDDVRALLAPILDDRFHIIDFGGK